MTTSGIGLRDTLWISAAFGLVAAPHALRLPWWITAVTAALIAWRTYLGRAHLELPRSWLLMVLVTGAAAGIYLHHRTLFGRDAGVALLVIMLALKLMETRSRRDALVVIFLGYFLVITNFLYSQTIPTALYMVGCVWVITAAMIGLNHARPPQGIRTELRLSAVLLVQSVPLMVVLFLFFPRVPGPLWGLPHDAYSGVSGLSDSMSPGSFVNLTLSDAVAFRVEFKSAIPEQPHLYWRGPVLWDFDGYTWTAPRSDLYRKPRLYSGNATVEYIVTLEPHNQRWLLALDLPGEAPLGAVISDEFEVRSLTPVTNRRRYAMSSYLDARYGIDEHPAVLRRALRLPPASNPHTAEFAAALRKKVGSERAFIQEVLAMFRNEPFYYTLSPPPVGNHPVDDFLFTTRSGFCEYYASAFAVLMRAAGIPARIVTGYLGGEVNPLGNYLIVRQADAHAWTEVWLEGEGWIRVDPTAAVSPLRVRSGIAAALPRTDPLPALVRGDYAWLRGLRFTWDSLANVWNQTVLGYSEQYQRRLLSYVGVDDATWRTLATFLVVSAALVVFGLLPFMLRRLRQGATDPVKRAYLDFCRRLARLGYPRDPTEGPVDYASRIGRLRPDLSDPVAKITELYIALRYGTRTNGLDAFRELLSEIRRLPV